MYSFALILNENLEKDWFLIIRERDESKLKYATDLMQNSMIDNLIKGKGNLTLDMIEKFTFKSIVNKIDWLNEGKILIVNNLGGTMFLEENHLVLKEEECFSFPLLEDDYLNGILFEDGSFQSCLYGEHSKLINQFSNINNAVFISTDLEGNNSALSIDGDINQCQIDFLKKNLNRLKKEHLETLKLINVI